MVKRCGVKLIVGLGNPGALYAGSRHNLGSSVIKALSRNYKIVLKNDRGVFALTGKVKIAGQAVLLAIPLTFMNLSGMAISALVKKYKINLDNLLVVCDDLDLELGRLKIKARGSPGGHRGLKSIINSLGSEGFSRLRVGIGSPAKNIDVSEYVLSPLRRKEKERAKEIIEKAIQCCRVWVEKGIVESMDIFNKREQIK